MKTSEFVEVRPSAIHGQGVFAKKRIDARHKIGELTGDVISVPEARRRAAKTHCITIVEFEDGFALDATRHPQPLKHVNHSCEPNTYMRRIRHRVEFYTLRAIAPEEELTCDYGETHHEGTLPCRCGARNCRGAI